MIEHSSEVSWPPTFKELTHESRDDPDIMQKFYDYLLAGDLHHETIKKKKENVMWCFFIKWQVLTRRQCAVGPVLHSFTGLKQLVA